MQGFTYSELITALQSWPEEGSDEYVDALPRIISLGELRLVRELNLEIFDQSLSSVVTGGDRFVDKPEGVVTTRSAFFVVGNTRLPLKMRSFDYLSNYWPDPTQVAVPKFICDYSETQWLLAGTPNQSASIFTRVVQRPAGLTNANPETWLSQNAGDLLFDCCLMEAENWMKADDRYADIKNKFYGEKLMPARLELRNSIRAGDYNPVRPAAQTVS